MPLLVRSATGTDAAACVEVFRPYVLDTVITFETEVPTVREMVVRIVAARVRHEWLVLQLDGDVAGYAYAHQFNSRPAYGWSVETSVYLAQDRRVGWKQGAWHDVGWWPLDLGAADDQVDPRAEIAT
jgi:L-amino acid N-acyltransferase YncA